MHLILKISTSCHVISPHLSALPLHLPPSCVSALTPRPRPPNPSADKTPSDAPAVRQDNTSLCILRVPSVFRKVSTSSLHAKPQSGLIPNVATSPAALSYTSPETPSPLTGTNYFTSNTLAYLRGGDFPHSRLKGQGSPRSIQPEVESER